MGLGKRTAAGGLVVLALGGCGRGGHHGRAVAIRSQTPSATATATATPAAAPVDCASAKCIAITFDDGPGEDTPRLLGMLAAYGAKSTFFILGRNAKDRPQLLRRMVAEGHELADHTYDHPALTRLSTDRIHQEIDRTAEIIKSATGRAPVMMRPPYGAYDARVAKAVGLPIILWKDDTLDWLHHDAARVARTVLKLASRNAVILLHDIHPTSVDAMRTILPELRRRHFTLVTVSELFKNHPLLSGKVYGAE